MELISVIYETLELPSRCRKLNVERLQADCRRNYSQHSIKTCTIAWRKKNHARNKNSKTSETFLFAIFHFSRRLSVKLRRARLVPALTFSLFNFVERQTSKMAENDSHLRREIEESPQERDLSTVKVSNRTFHESFLDSWIFTKAF